jgi:hypothetical protein
MPYFFPPWPDYLFAYRNGPRKRIYDATTGRREVYDLRRDPHEEHPAPSEADELSRLAAWIQYQQRLFLALIPVR